MKNKASMASASAVMIALVLVVYLGFFQTVSESHLNLHDADEWEDSIHATPNSKYKYTWPECERDSSVESISGFDTLPDHIKDFLYYQHCRHFSMLLDAPHKCGGPKGSAHVFLLLVIKSSPVNYDRREVLRNTWARERIQNGVWIRRLFISGTQETGYNQKRLNRLLALEQRKYHDILQWDFHDSFFNLTLKQVLFLEWMERNCPHVRFLLNGDDDVFANTDNMILYLQNLPDNNGSKHLFAGDVIKGARPIRSENSKYYIPPQVYDA
ncbi:N-acetyllactosaminide beta-1,3-N-acetylglucosaminyltransferase 3-like, partial [Oryzias melastigma]